MTTTTAPATKSIQELIAKSGVLKVNLGQLRDELGYARLGKKVLKSMSEYLSENGLGYFPGGLLNADTNPEPRQWQEVTLYRRDGSAKAAVLDAMAEPDTHDLMAALDMFGGEAPDFTSMKDAQRLAYIKQVLG